LIANPALASEMLGWKAGNLDPREHIESAWKWMRGSHGGRYAD